jgi:hypothetical protein
VPRCLVGFAQGSGHPDQEHRGETVGSAQLNASRDADSTTTVATECDEDRPDRIGRCMSLRRTRSAATQRKLSRFRGLFGRHVPALRAFSERPGSLVPDAAALLGSSTRPGRD